MGQDNIAARVAMPAAVARCVCTRLPGLLAGLAMNQGFSYSTSTAGIVGKQSGIATIDISLVH